MAARLKYRVFISHATADKWIAATICEKAETVGAATFRDDRDINGGDDIPKALRQAIRESDEVLVLLTPASVKRPWVLIEVGAAWERGKLIVPIRYLIDVDEIPSILQNVKAIELNDVGRYLSELKARCGRKRRKR